MKCGQLISDLHTEFYEGKALDFVSQLQFVSGLDFLLLPGDIVVVNGQSLGECREVFEFLGGKARHVIYTVGNHEYYGSQQASEVESALKSILPSNFHWLENEEATVDGVHFYGGCMWFPNDPLNAVYRDEINDFRLIPDLGSWVYRRNLEFTENARRFIRQETVVLSHHLCSAESTPPEFQASHSNRFFVTEQRALMLEKEPRLWVHGHTHSACRYRLGEATEVVSSPYGYPGECNSPATYTPLVLYL